MLQGMMLLWRWSLRIHVMTLLWRRGLCLCKKEVEEAAALCDAGDALDGVELEENYWLCQSLEDFPFGCGGETLGGNDGCLADAGTSVGGETAGCSETLGGNDGCLPDAGTSVGREAAGCPEETLGGNEGCLHDAGTSVRRDCYAPGDRV